MNIVPENVGNSGIYWIGIPAASGWGDSTAPAIGPAWGDIATDESLWTPLDQNALLDIHSYLPSAPGPTAYPIGRIQDQSVGIWGTVYMAPSGKFYWGGNGGWQEITWLTPQQIAAEIASTTTALSQINHSIWNSPVLDLALLGAALIVAPTIIASFSTAPVASAAAPIVSAGSSVDTSALVSALNAQDAAQAALEQSLSDAGIAVSSGSADAAQTALSDAVQAAQTQADTLAANATDIGASATDSATLTAAQNAQTAASALQTAATNASAVSISPWSAASLLSDLKTAAGAAAAAGGLLHAVTGLTKPRVSTPYLTQAPQTGISSTMAIPLLALLAVAFLAVRK